MLKKTFHTSACPNNLALASSSPSSAQRQLCHLQNSPGLAMHKSCLPNLIEWWLWQTLSTWKAPFLLSLIEPEKNTASSNGNAKEGCSRAAPPQGCHPPPSRACISLVLSSRPPLRQTPLNTHPSPEQVQSNAGNHLSRHQVWAPPSKFALLLGKGCVDSSCMQRNINHIHSFNAIQRAPTLLFL